MIRWLTRLGAALARALPVSWLHAWGDAIGWLLFHLLASRRRLALQNMALILGEQHDGRARVRMLHASLRNMAKTMLELLKLPTMSEQQLVSLTPARGVEHLEEAVSRGKGVIVVTAHFGSWELLAARISQLGYPLTVIARDANDPPTAQIIRQARESAGVRVAERHEVRRVLRALRRGEVVGILPDQHGGDAGIWVAFLGRPASTVSGPAALAYHTGAAIVPGFARRRSDERVDVYFLPALELPDTGDREADVRHVTEMINDVMGEQIRRYPAQWMWMHNRWRTPPSLEHPEPVAT
ncbi:MAG: lysophospholipid acyltransferase family protein [Armatimonadota bacterium]